MCSSRDSGDCSPAPSRGHRTKGHCEDGQGSFASDHFTFPKLYRGAGSPGDSGVMEAAPNSELASSLGQSGDAGQHSGSARLQNLRLRELGSGVYRRTLPRRNECSSWYARRGVLQSSSRAPSQPYNRWDPANAPTGSPTEATLRGVRPREGCSGAVAAGKRSSCHGPSHRAYGTKHLGPSSALYFARAADRDSETQSCKSWQANFGRMAASQRNAETAPAERLLLVGCSQKGSGQPICGVDVEGPIGGEGSKRHSDFAG